MNERLWDIEDGIRECERAGDFGPKFVELARSVYFNNDHRAAIKRRINMLLGSKLIEEKSYAWPDGTFVANYFGRPRRSRISTTWSRSGDALFQFDERADGLTEKPAGLLWLRPGGTTCLSSLAELARVVHNQLRGTVAPLRTNERSVAFTAIERGRVLVYGNCKWPPKMRPESDTQNSRGGGTRASTRIQAQLSEQANRPADETLLFVDDLHPALPPSTSLPE